MCPCEEEQDQSWEWKDDFAFVKFKLERTLELFISIYLLLNLDGKWLCIAYKTIRRCSARSSLPSYATKTASCVFLFLYTRYTAMPNIGMQINEIFGLKMSCYSDMMIMM